jgi:pyocin large subunit-like protein
VSAKGNHSHDGPTSVEIRTGGHAPTLESRMSDENYEFQLAYDEGMIRALAAGTLREVKAGEAISRIANEYTAPSRETLRWRQANKNAEFASALITRAQAAIEYPEAVINPEFPTKDTRVLKKWLAARNNRESADNKILTDAIPAV